MRSGPHPFLDGQLHWYIVDNISINLCKSSHISDAGWMGYLEGILKIGQTRGVHAMASLVHFSEAMPNSVQRNMTAKFVREHALPPVSIALLSDSTIERGAVTALNWLLPSLKTRAFGSKDLVGALTWLGTLASFDAVEAERCVRDSWEQLRLAR